MTLTTKMVHEWVNVEYEAKKLMFCNNATEVSDYYSFFLFFSVFPWRATRRRGGENEKRPSSNIKSLIQIGNWPIWSNNNKHWAWIERESKSFYAADTVQGMTEAREREDNNNNNNNCIRRSISNAEENSKVSDFISSW